MEAKHILLLVTVILVIGALLVHKKYEGETHSMASPVKPLNQNSGPVQSDSDSGLISL